ncbi:hypothetical protein [Thermococcus sp.]|uniref:hypothetical protein n=1 Tax=Thermococcus sp. TaxID=35749 RepID=UPI002610CEEB|nr:hypothetical protein [Thermococcus sp.]
MAITSLCVIMITKKAEKECIVIMITTRGNEPQEQTGVWEGSGDFNWVKGPSLMTGLHLAGISLVPINAV